MKPYTKTERFAVVRKPSQARRYYANFKRLYENREEAEVDAMRLMQECKGKFYVIEILSITPTTISLHRKVVDTDTPKYHYSGDTRS